MIVRPAKGSTPALTPPRRERGAVIVELTIVVPLLLLLVLGLVELGFRTHSAQTIVGATRSAARVGSSAGDDRLADYVALQALAGGLRDYEAAEIERIIIFNANAADGSLPAGCESASVPGECNHYSASDFSLAPSAFTSSGSGCSFGSPDLQWCPLGRDADQYPNADWIGVEVWINHSSTAPFLGDTVLKERTIMRLEPRFEP